MTVDPSHTSAGSTPDSAAAVTRGSLLRWIGWFGIANAVLFALIGTRYLIAFGMPVSGAAGLYVALAFVGQFALLGFLPLMLLLGPIALVLPRKGLVMTVAVMVIASAVTVLVLDTNIFAQYRYHISRLTVEIFEVSTWVFAGTIFVAMVAFQAMLAGNIWQRVSTKNGRAGIWLALALITVWLGGQSLHIWADATAYSPVTSFTRYLPVYFPIKAKRRLAKLGWVDPEKVEQQRLLRRAGAAGGDGQLLYPLNPLQCDAPQPLPNILVIMVDALRPDHVDENLAPHIAEFATYAQNFKNHSSGGNSSRMGFFSMFYGLPSTYWQAFYDGQKPPLLMEQVQANNYDVMVMSAVGFGSPAQLDRTLFASVEAVDRYTAQTKLEGNGEITSQWQAWFTARASNAQPFFSMLYYDPGLSNGADPQSAAELGEVERRYAAYERGVAAVDDEVAVVLETLGQQREETLVILASDHGYEFDELGLGNIGHGSNFGPWQLRSVLLLDWPGKTAREFSHRSAHQDLPGTLMREVFGCENPYADYSSGGNLFDEQSWEWIMAGSYSSHAIVEPDKIVVTYPGGLIELLDANYRPSSGLKLDPQRVEEAMLEMRRFYK
jgi:membrane-anchored protein YejM (alkaline phosphatase superfamily)